MLQPMKASRQWLAQVRADITASTDASLLAVARFLGLLYGPIDCATGCRRTPPGVTPWVVSHTCFSS
jgi:hypothetical protein